MRRFKPCPPYGRKRDDEKTEAVADTDGPLAQRNRAARFYRAGRGFESLMARVVAEARRLGGKPATGPARFSHGMGAAGIGSHTKHAPLVVTGYLAGASSWRLALNESPNIESMEEKMCPKCNRSLTLSAFSRNASEKDGLQSRCRE